MVKKSKFNLKKRKFRIISSFAPVYKDCDFNKSLETEGIHGEEFEVFKIKNGYAKGVLINDNYKGWIKLNYLGLAKQPTHKVRTLGLFV